MLSFEFLFAVYTGPALWTVFFYVLKELEYIVELRLRLLTWKRVLELVHYGNTRMVLLEILDHLYGKCVLQRDEIELFVLTVGAFWPVVCGRFAVILPWTNLTLSLLLARLMDNIRKAELADDLLAIVAFSDVKWNSLATDALN